MKIISQKPPIFTVKASELGTGSWSPRDVWKKHGPKMDAKAADQMHREVRQAIEHLQAARDIASAWENRGMLHSQLSAFDRLIVTVRRRALKILH